MLKNNSDKLMASLRMFSLTGAFLLASCGGGNSGPTSVAETPKPAQVTAVNTVSVNDGNIGLRSAQESVNAFVLPASPEAKKVTVSSQTRTNKPTPTLIDLGNVSQPKNDEMREQQLGRPEGKAMQVGFARVVLQSKDSAATGQILQWSATAEGGQTAALSFRSGTAEGIRIGLVVQSLPADATIRFYSSTSTATFDVSGKTINDTLALNLAAGDSSEDGRTYWGPFLKGQTGILEIELPKNVAISAVKISIPKISHFFLDPLGKESISAASGGDGNFSPEAAATCNLDVTCNTPLSAASRSVAKMSFLVNGSGYICTGTLLNNSQSDGIPYFLSADHCISNQTVASSLTTYWFYRSSGCNNGVLNPDFQTLTGGATLLYNRSNFSGAPATDRGTDTSFMRLNAPPPINAVFSGWTVTPQSVSNASYTGLHNPAGDLQKYSLGQITGFFFIDSTGKQFQSNSNSSSAMYRVNWQAGTTEGGSSGSGLFLNADTNPMLVGQLWGGISSCSSPTSNLSLYGRFDIAYQERLAVWLSPSTLSVSRFFNSASGSHFYTISYAEVKSILASYPGFRYEGTAYFTSPSANVNLMPVYRFRNKINGSYLWSISPEERTSINLNYGTTFVEEGIAWYSNLVTAPGYVPLYRFRNIQSSTYFYTASEAEKDSVVASYRQTFLLEGIAYYVKNNL